ncbi:MAG: penicillin acylase family protein [Acidimicrobiales bacterium]
MTTHEEVFDGIDGVVEIERDRHGIPRIRASSIGDLFVGQGVATATDRLGQMEWDRRRGLGRIAELHGSAANVVTDSVHRRLRLADHARAGYDQLDDQTRAVLDAFVAGVNAAAASVPTPRQLASVGVTAEPWEPWTPVLIFLVRHVNFATWQTKLWKARVLAALGPDAVTRFGREGRQGITPLIVPSGAVAALDEIADAGLDDATTASIVDELVPLGLGESGSNGWAVHGSRTASGSPLVAGDPHRALEMPNVYYQVHLVGPGIDASGLSFVGVPGIQHFAQTDAVAWGVTNAMGDYQDLFIERLPDAVVDRRVERIDVRNGDPVSVECLMTERGPVVVGGSDHGIGLSLATTGFDRPGGSLATILPFLRARSVEDLDRAMAAWVEPANNFVFADTGGRVAYRTAGSIPQRHPLNQHLPVPAWDDTFTWRGTIEFDDLPSERDAPTVVTANQRITAGAIGEAIAADYALPSRAVRIRARLDQVGDSGHCVEDQRLIQTDDVWLGGLALARRLHVTGLAPELADWDGRLSASSETAALVVLTFGHLVRRVAAELPAPLRTNPFAAWEPPATTYPVETRVAEGLAALLDGGGDELVPGLRWVDHLGDAIAAARAEPAAHWGDLHRLTPSFGLRGADADLDTALTITSPPLGGGRDCVWATTQLDGIFTNTYVGPTARYVWDLADRSASRWIVPLGASGEPGDPHVDDQLAAWSSGELIPVIDPTVVATTTLRPS